MLIGFVEEHPGRSHAGTGCGKEECGAFVFEEVQTLSGYEEEDKQEQTADTGSQQDDVVAGKQNHGGDNTV